MSNFAQLAFNLIPLGFVLWGEWRPFDVVAFYWVELIAVGLFAFLRSIATAGSVLIEKRRWRDLVPLVGQFVLPVHFGFFVVLMCFGVGSFLPEGTPTRKLTSPFVPLEVVIENVEFIQVFSIACLWQIIYLIRDARKGRLSENQIGVAYRHLAILFISLFPGLILGKLTDARIWGAISLVAVKSLADWIWDPER